MNIRVSVWPKRTRYRNRSRKLPVSLWLLLAGCVSENVHLSLRFLLAMRYRAASASLRRPWEYNQRGDSGMNLKETSLKAVYSYRDAYIERRQFTYGGWSVLGLKPDSPTGTGKTEGAHCQQHATLNSVCWMNGNQGHTSKVTVNMVNSMHWLLSKCLHTNDKLSLPY